MTSYVSSHNGRTKPVLTVVDTQVVGSFRGACGILALGLGQLARLKLVVLPLNALMLNDNLAQGTTEGTVEGKEFKDIFININIYFIFI